MPISRYTSVPPAMVTFLCGLCLSSHTAATSYGIYDARALSMAGTAVAVGDINQAHYYNPSLVAFHKGHEDRTRDGRHSLSFVASRLSDGARTAGYAISDDLEGRLSRAIDQLNDVPTTEAANIGIQAAQDLEQAMRDLDGNDIDADGYIGYSITLPADGEGGAFFIGSRLVGAGVSAIEDSDYELLNDYVEALTFIASEGAQGEQHPELFNADNELYNPGSQIVSSASGTGIALTEIGISGAKQWQPWGVTVAIGGAPKLVQLRTYGDSWRVVEGTFDSNSLEERSLYFNLDLGATAVLKERYRVAVSVKDLRQRSFVTADGRRVQLQPRARLGLAYVHPKIQLGMDFDLDKNNNLHTLVPQQVISMGAEYVLIDSLKLRLGYQHDMDELGDDRLTAGVGWKLGRFAAEFAYSSGDIGDGAALQLSFYQ